jgi:two-component system NtrC family sensor kinase
MNRTVLRINEREKAEEILAERERLAALSSDISTALVRVTDIQDSLHYRCEAIVRHLDAAFARVWTLDQENNILELQASAGIHTHIDSQHSRKAKEEYWQLP